MRWLTKAERRRMGTLAMAELAGAVAVSVLAAHAMVWMGCERRWLITFTAWIATLGWLAMARWLSGGRRI